MVIKDDIYDICIVGGGASGMTAAIISKYANPDLRVLILEKNDMLGRKLKATGNGRCNITNTNADNYINTLSYFTDLSILPIEEEGRIYPNSEDSRDVINALVGKIHDLNIKVLTSISVVGIKKENDVFNIKTTKSAIISIKVLIATGGKAAPIYGSTGDGYTLSKNLGHSITMLAPVLTPVECNGDYKTLKGIRSKGILSLELNKKIIFQEKGEIQFTDYGVSGICVFNATRFMKFVGGEGLKPYTLYFNFAPNIDMLEYLKDRKNKANSYNSNETVETILRGVVKAGISKRIIELVNIKRDRKISSISQKEIINIANTSQSFPIKPIRLKGWKMAQCTSGGVLSEEINMDTLESKLVDNLYFAGEVLDYDGPCGGFNLDYAWHTGALAGRNMSK